MTAGKARKSTKRDGFVLDIVDPHTGKRTSRGLGTADQDEAENIARDYSTIGQRQHLLTAPMDHIQELSTFHVKAVELHLGRDHAAVRRLRELQDPKIGLTEADLDEAETLAREVLLKELPAPSSRRISTPARPGSPAAVFEEHLNAAAVSNFDALMRTQMDQGLAWIGNAIRKNLAQLLPRKGRALAERVTSLEIENRNYRSRMETMQSEIDILRRQTNAHVTVTVKEAYETFQQSDRFRRLADKTKREMKATFDAFLQTLPDPAKFKLAELRANHIQTWLDALRAKDGEELSVRSLAKLRQYVCSVISSLYRRHDLAENPGDKLEPGRTPIQNRLEIAAFGKPDEIVEMLDALGQVSLYWQALVGTAVLAGPRYSELVSLHIDDVDLAQNLIAVRGFRDLEGKLIRGTKTGRQRRTPLERTTLLPILQAYLIWRQKQKVGAFSSPWLFPSTVPPHPYLERRKSLPGTWSSNRVFLNAWEAAAKEAQSRTTKEIRKQDYWEFGPREWRHSACTAMGNSGIDAERGSSWVGNSPAIWRSHYCRPSSGGELWPFRW